MSRAELHASVSEHFARYFDACDRADIDAVMGIMQGAVVSAGDVETSDATAVRAMYESRQPPPLADGRRVTKHHVTNILVDGPDDSGAYEASAYYFRLQADAGGPHVAASGRLHQVLIPDIAGWRVLRHSIISDF
jgi:hypothetical protein